MSKKAKIITVAVFVALVAVIAIVAVALNKKSTSAGVKSFTIEITSERDDFDETKEIKASDEFLGQYLRTMDGLKYDETEYGIYITGYNDMEQDLDNQYWWCLYVNGESSMTGADEVPLNDGDSYALVLTQGW